MDAATLQPGRQFGAYRIDRPLGSGGFADVYLARHILLDQPVALKVVRGPDNSDRERQGARLMCRFRHPNIVTVHSADHIDGRLVLAMDYVEGATLRERMDRQGVFPGDEAVRVVSAVCDALDYVHHFNLDDVTGFAHLDLKPGNILMGRDGVVRVTDFGLAAARGGAGSAAHPLAGSPAYMAPEQFTGQAGPASDIWALGILLHELVTGEQPIGMSRERDGRVALDRTAAFCRGVEPGLANVINRCLQPDPANRFASAGALRCALFSCGPLAAACGNCGSPMGEDAACPECTRALLPSPPVTMPRADGKTRAPARRASRGASSGLKWVVAVAAGVITLAGSGYAGHQAYRTQQATALRAAFVNREEAAREADERAEAEALAQVEQLETAPDVTASRAIAAWQAFLAADRPAANQTRARARIAHWQQQLKAYRGWAEVRVVSARGLPAADTGLTGDEQADPYFILRADGDFVYRSLSVKNAPAPSWNEAARVLVAPGRSLMLDIFDRDPVGDDLLATVPLTPFPADGRFTRALGSITVVLEILRER